MAYDRYDTRDERSRWSNDFGSDRTRDRSRETSSWDRGRDDRSRDDRGRDDRGFFERAGDEIASWFGDDDAERRRGRDEQMNRDYDRGHGRDRDQNPNRGLFNRGGSSERDYNPDWRREYSSGRDRGYRPMTGDYGRSTYPESDQFFAASGYGRGEREYDRSQSPWGRDDYRRTSRAGTSDMSDRSRREDARDRDPHYWSWRERHLGELDRDYDDYRREHQSKFESDFGSWRERRQQKRGLLSQIREHMDVVGSDDEHVGTIDKVAGDRIILTKSDPESGGVHHSLSCSDIDRVDGDRVVLDCSAEEAKKRWRDESRSRALFEREDQGERGPRSLNRSFEGTYR
jgi:hypothetical protein